MDPSTADRAPRGLRLHGYIGIAIIVLAELDLLVFHNVLGSQLTWQDACAGKGPAYAIPVLFVARWFTAIAWWGYILLIDSIIFRIKGQSLICSRPRQFALMLPLSVICWLLFELYDTFLQNWVYVNLPASIAERWLGYSIAFATIFPALFCTAELLKEVPAIGRLRSKPLRVTPAMLWTFVVLGLLMVVLPLVLRDSRLFREFQLPEELRPSLLFVRGRLEQANASYLIPLVWVGYVFLLEPLNYLARRESILRDLEKGQMANAAALVLSGAVCGLLWEFWNYWAYTKWHYTVPYLPDVKLFEMPVLGYLGFLPFTLECYAMYAFARFLLNPNRPEEAGALGALT